MYTILAVVLMLGYVILSYVRWQSTANTHTLMESVATFLALFVGVIALVRHYSKKRLVFLLIGTGLLGAAFLDFYHMVVTSPLFVGYFPSAPSSMIPQSWLASRLYLATLVGLSWLIWHNQRKSKYLGVSVEIFVYVLVVGLVVTNILVFSFVSLPRQVYYPNQFFHRPADFIPALLFLVAVIGHAHKKHWKQDDIDHWLFLSLLMQIAVHVPFMVRSNQWFDIMFNTAHLLKISSYLCILIGVLLSTYHLFKQAEESNQKISGTNKQLQREISERKQIENILRESEEKYRTLVDNIQDGVFLIQDGNIIFINESFANMIGYATESIIGKSINEFVAPEDMELVINRYQQRITGKDVQPKQMETELRTAYHNLKKLNHQLQNELDLAQEIQQGLLPSANPHWHDLDIACYSTPASKVGGDLYAYHAFGQQRYGIAVGDVSGKGSPAALLMAVTIASFQSIVQRDLGPASLLAKMDEALIVYTNKVKQNCAFVYLEIDLKDLKNSSGFATAKMVNAGCTMPIIKRRHDSVEWVDIGGMPLGVGLGSQSGYMSETRHLSKGDMIILTSDGIVEAMNLNNDMFGFERFEKVIKEGPQTTALEMLTHVLIEVTTFVGDTEPHDDMTIVVVQV
ncbi:MAG: hypothetical protein B6242_12860 [Anaerolineaceae bacterium 4572_78]|nr:MAG: hypothetical protein B6242_12860 [Anaerolineaceae bacterium 4572_78]